MLKKLMLAAALLVSGAVMAQPPMGGGPGGGGRPPMDGQRGPGGPGGPGRGPGGPQGQQRRGIDKSYDSVLTAMIKTVPKKFKTKKFKDAETGREMTYNIYAPKDWKKTSYPLVLFMPDGSTVNKGAEYALTQGWGGLIWATDESQAKNPCIVLVPSFDGPGWAVNDEWQVSDEVTCCKNLVDYIVDEYKADSNRLYTTGQSMGGMISFHYMVTYPDYFAAAMFVSSQWDPKVLKPLEHDKFFWVISAADPKAAPMMKEVADMFVDDGVAVGEIEFSARLPMAEQNALVDGLIAKDLNINFVEFTPGTVQPPGQEDNKMGEHMYGFDAAYRLSSVRDWLFQQHK